MILAGELRKEQVKKTKESTTKREGGNVKVNDFLLS